MTKRRRFTDDFKARVALEALRGDKTVQEIASKHKVHPNQVSTWKRQAINYGDSLLNTHYVPASSNGPSCSPCRPGLTHHVPRVATGAAGYFSRTPTIVFIWICWPRAPCVLNVRYGPIA